MKPDDVKNLKGFYPSYWHDSAASMPTGWTGIIAEFLGDAANVGDLLDAVSCRFGRTISGLKVFCFPEMVKWSPEQMAALHEAQRMLYQLSQQTCERCGQPGGPCHIGRVTFFFCQEHAANAREKLTSKIEAYEERIQFRGEVSCLFQPMSVVSLNVNDINMPILRKALLDIKKIVEERALIGKVFVTKILESEGQLFLSARCDQADPATQFEIADIVKHAEWESDQAALEAGKEEVDDDAR